ncbi:hypothetical protein GCM10009720_25600 [Yaniella flava]|uniref:D-inositol 3-phosphate glycosyltransferase n=2 Tax=Yaniella flava TaxID=287930 RepID=A0ABP5GF96_9MICC
MQRHIQPSRDLKSLIDWARAIRKVRPHVVNLGTPKASLLGIFAAWIHRVPKRIYTVRGLRLEGTSGLLSRLLWIMERATIMMATDVIAISPSLAKELVRRRLTSWDDVWLIGEGSSNGVDTVKIKDRIAQVDGSSLRRQLGIEPGKFVVGYIGRVTPAKGVDVLLTALKSTNLRADVELLIIGSIEDSALETVIQATSSRIRVVPWTDDMWGYLPAIDLLCLPTLREGFGNVVIEAAAAGIPAITTRVTGAIDTIVDGETGLLVDARDAEALVDCFNLLADDRGLARRLGDNAQHRAETQFQPEKIWSGIEAIALGRYDLPQPKRLPQYLESSDVK